MDAFGYNSVSDLFVDDDTNGARVDVEDASGSAVVVFIGHALVDGSINHDIDDITNFVSGEGLGNVNGSSLFEAFSEFVSGSSLISVAVGHGNK